MTRCDRCGNALDLTWVETASDAGRACCVASRLGSGHLVPELGAEIERLKQELTKEREYSAALAQDCSELRRTTVSRIEASGRLAECEARCAQAMRERGAANERAEKAERERDEALNRRDEVEWECAGLREELRVERKRHQQAAVDRDDLTRERDEARAKLAEGVEHLRACDEDNERLRKHAAGLRLSYAVREIYHGTRIADLEEQLAQARVEGEREAADLPRPDYPDAVRVLERRARESLVGRAEELRAVESEHADLEAQLTRAKAEGAREALLDMADDSFAFTCAVTGETIYAVSVQTLRDEAARLAGEEPSHGR